MHLNQELIRHYVEENPNRPGPADVRIVGYGVSVWAIIGYLEAVNGDLGKAAEDYGLPREAVEAAVAYYNQNKAIVDARLAANAA